MDERYQYIIEEEDTELPLKELLKRRLGFSSRLLRQIKVRGQVYLDGSPVRLNVKGKTGERITVILPEECSDFPPEDIPINVIYEDPDLLAINKQPGIVVHPTKGHLYHTIANGVMKYMLDKGDRYKIRFINRLDRDTTGVLLIGKNSFCQDDFTRQASEGLVEKKYIAVVKGIVMQDEGVIDLPVGRPTAEDIKRAIMPDGYPSVTHYRVIEHFDKGYTLLQLSLETGRTHQIRVHLSHIGHPVAGDTIYGGENPELIDRQALHAEELSFRHPVTGERLTLNAPLPEDMDKLIRSLR